MWTSVAAQAWTSPWPQVAELATDNMLVPSLLVMLKPFHFSFSPITSLHIAVASAAGGSPVVGLLLTYSVCALCYLCDMATGRSMDIIFPFLYFVV